MCQAGSSDRGYYPELEMSKSKKKPKPRPKPYKLVKPLSAFDVKMLCIRAIEIQLASSPTECRLAVQAVREVAV